MKVVVACFDLDLFEQSGRARSVIKILEFGEETCDACGHEIWWSCGICGPIYDGNTANLCASRGVPYLGPCEGISVPELMARKRVYDMGTFGHRIEGARGIEPPTHYSPPCPDGIINLKDGAP